MDSIFLPSEIFYQIGKFLVPRDSFSFSLTCKRIYDSLGFYDEGLKLASYNLSLEQKETLENLKKKAHKPILLLKAPPSMGKTILTLSFLLWEGQLNLIIVPPSLIENWVQEIQKTLPLFFSENPLESKTLIYHSSYSKHRSYIDEKKKNPLDLGSVRFIITSIRLYESLKDLSYNRIVVDESHRSKMSFDEWNKKGVLLVSASAKITKKQKKNKDFSDVSISNHVVANVVPSYRRFFIKADIWNGISEEITNTHRKIILFLNSTSRYFSLHIEGYRIFQHKQSNKIIEEFNSHEGKAILMSTYRKLSTGHNLEGTAAIFDSSNNHSTTMHLQSESRLLRLTNKEKGVSFYYFDESERNLQLVRYNLIAVDLVRKYNFNWYRFEGHLRVDWGYISRAFSSLGISFSDLNDEEFLYYCNADVTRGKYYIFFKERGLINQKIREEMIPYYKGRTNDY